MLTLQLTIVGCTGLVPDDKAMNPYCTIQLGGKGGATEPCTNTQDPIWNKTFTFTVADPEEAKGHVCVWNKTLTKDVFIGDYWVNIGEILLVRGSPSVLNVPLGKSTGNSELRMIVTAIDFGVELPPGEEEGCQAQQEIFDDDHDAPLPVLPAPTQAATEVVAAVPAAPRSMPSPTTTKGVSLPPTTGRVLIRSNAFGTNLQGHNGCVCTSTNTRAYEVWNISTLTDGRYVFQSHDNGYLHADSKGNVGTVANCEDCEKWFVEPHPVVPGTFIIVSHHGTCLQAERGGGVGGFLASALSSSSQSVSVASEPVEGDMWAIISLAGSGVDVGGGMGVAKSEEGGAYASIRSFHNTYLHGHGGKVCTSQDEEATSRKTTWTICALGDGKYSLCTQDGTFLRADPKLYVNTASSCQDWEKWYIEAHPNVPGKAAIRSHHGTFLRADEGTNTVDLAVRPLEWEAWEVLPV